MTSPDRQLLDEAVRHKEMQDVYIRVARDLHFRCDAVEVARVAGIITKFHPLEFWIALGFDNMTRIADGSHPCVAEYRRLIAERGEGGER